MSPSQCNMTRCPSATHRKQFEEVEPDQPESLVSAETDAGHFDFRQTLREDSQHDDGAAVKYKHIFENGMASKERI